MEPTYQPGHTLTYNPADHAPSDGQVVVFHPPSGAPQGICGNVQKRGEACTDPTPGHIAEAMILRVVGVPGDHVAMVSSYIVRNGHKLSEPYVERCPSLAGCQYPAAVTVPAGHYYVIADNRQDYQFDSRYFGAIPPSDIVGVVNGR
jgi:signal peptidase I